MEEAPPQDPEMAQEGDPGQAVPALHDRDVSMAVEATVPLLVDLTQLPVEALLNALNRRPEAELREASNRLTALGAKVGAKVVAIRTDRGRAGGQKAKIKSEIRTACSQCRRTHFKCDSAKPCGRCVSKGWSQECSFEDDGDLAMPQKSSAPRPRKKPPIQKPGYSSSGDKLCEHGMEKRYCLHATCVSQGGGKAMCKHGKRKRSCTDPDCMNETEERRRQIHDGRCKHGVQMRCCTEDECRIDFQLAGHQYREKLKERKRASMGEPGEGTVKPKPKRGRPPGPRTAGPPRAAGGEGDVTETHDGDGTDKAVTAAVMALSGQDVSVVLVSVAPVQEMGVVHAVDEADKKREEMMAAKEAAAALVPASLAAPTADDVRQPDPPQDVGEHGAPQAEQHVSHDGSGADGMGHQEGAHKHDAVHEEEHHEEGKATNDMPMGTAPQNEHVEVVEAAHHPAPPLEGDHQHLDHQAGAGDGGGGDAGEEGGGDCVNEADHPGPPAPQHSEQVSVEDTATAE